MDGKLQTLDQLLTTTFLQTHTKWIDFQEFREGLPIKLEKCDKELQFIKDAELDNYIQMNCGFSNWNHFIAYLKEEYQVRQLGLSLKDYD
ncbi:hypothetical protein MUN89_15580 [Halobacillus salinarum]|uniref:Uncharacterized protein n=1 Tax=Halobacillus salinarum TaxID=2932257 RepID=A0ABY4EMJ9_9BACI|nr:hypothetical protein [Halobacillus salinarum]UOQ43331.1 hypothetical protein MUN89_15580 [Halobacillus salinarum]